MCTFDVKHWGPTGPSPNEPKSSGRWFSRGHFASLQSAAARATDFLVLPPAGKTHILLPKKIVNRAGDPKKLRFLFFKNSYVVYVGRYPFLQNRGRVCSDFGHGFTHARTYMPRKEKELACGVAKEGWARRTVVPIRVTPTKNGAADRRLSLCAIVC